MNIIRLELESVKREISIMLQDRNDEFVTMINDSLSQQLTVENLQEQVDYQVKQLIQRAIDDLGTNHSIRMAVRQTLEQMIIKQIKKGDREQ